MQDLMDGFFPSELQARYPDGVPFEVQALYNCNPLKLFIYYVLMANKK